MVNDILFFNEPERFVADPGFFQGRTPASEAESCLCYVVNQSCASESEASYLQPGSRAHLRALKAFGF